MAGIWNFWTFADAAAPGSLTREFSEGRVYPAYGLTTSLAFVLSIEDSGRFKDPRDVGAYVGLVPRREQLARTCQAL